MAVLEKEVRPPGLRIDASALHPDLCFLSGGCENYFSDLSKCRASIKAALAEALGIEHDLYLVANTSNGLLAVMAGLKSADWRLQVSAQHHHDAYEELLSYAASAGRGRIARFVTHVDSKTGHVTDLNNSDGSLLIVDGAQSFGTKLHNDLVNRADVFLAPLHKHVGVAIGVGVIGVRKDMIALQCIREAATIAEQGMTALDLLRGTCKRLEQLKGRIVNIGTLSASWLVRKKLARHGIEVLTPPRDDLPFICIKGVDERLLDQTLELRMISLKLFEELSVLRITCSVRGRLRDPLRDLSDELWQRFQADVCI